MAVTPGHAGSSDGDEPRASPFVSSLIGSRLQPPRSRLRLVRRQGILRELSAGAVPLVVVAAPGGFGKTIALAQWVENDPRRCAWLQADGADDDPFLFLAYLLAALDGVVEIDPGVVDWMQLVPPPVATRILPAIAAAVAAARPFLVVIDDVHLITNPACWRMVELLVDQVPAGAQVCLAGRAEPPLPLARLRAEGRVLELGPEGLALTPTEIGELLELQGAPADPATVAYIARVTEGWAAGSYLAALAGSGTPKAAWLSGIQGHRGDIARYLASEVLDRAPEEIRRFFLETSILERLSPGLCRAVTGRPDAGELLRTLARQNLFVSALDDADEWFRYHHLFAEFLQGELAGRDENDLRGLHARAAQWFEAHDGLEEAVRHWLAAGEAKRAGDIVCRVHMDYGKTARHETTRRWLEMFTDEQILGDQALTIAAGFIGPMAGDTPRGRAWVHAALRMRVGDGQWPGSQVSLRAMQAVLVAALAPEGVAQMRRNAELALSPAEGVDPTEHAAASSLLGIACWLAGDHATAGPYLRAGEEEGAVAHCLAQVAAVGTQALILGEEGRWDEAREKALAGLARCEEAGIGWTPDVLPILLARVQVEARQGDPRVTERVATLWENIAHSHVPDYLVVAAAAILGEVLAQRSELAGATRWVRMGVARLASCPDAGVFGPRLLRLRETLERQEVAEPLTAGERRVLELLSTELTQKEIASRLRLSSATVHTHVESIYRKLDAHVRSEAVEKARAVRFID